MRNKYGQTALMLLIDSDLNNKEKFIDIFIENCADFNMISNDGTTALICAMKSKANMLVIQKIISNSNDVNQINKHNYSAIRYAIESDNVELIKVLIDAGAKLEVALFKYLEPNSKAMEYLKPSIIKIEYQKLIFENALKDIRKNAYNKLKNVIIDNDYF